jgi:hypothetical protein
LGSRDYHSNTVLGLIVLLWTIAAPGFPTRPHHTRSPQSDKEVIDAIPLALEILQSKNLDISDLKEEYQHLHDSKSLACNRACVELWNNISQRSEIRRVVSNVEVKTKKAGANVKYLSLGEKISGSSPLTFKGITTAKEDLVIGVYYLWTERDGKSTSDKSSRYVVINPTEKIEIVERH